MTLNCDRKLLAEKTAMVTGANRGIGKAIAERFAAHGARLFLGGRNLEALSKVCAELQAAHDVEAAPLVVDVANARAVKDAFQELFKQAQRLDILVNNAGVLDDALIGMVSVAQVESVFGINAFGPIYCSQYAARLMSRRGGGSIINLSSIIGTNGNEGQAVYSASKAAVIGLTRSLAKELASVNIRVNAIAPGFIDTDMAHSIPPEKFQERMESIAMARIGTPLEVADVAVFLASEMSSYVTGQVLGVDGGMLV